MTYDLFFWINGNEILYVIHAISSALVTSRNSLLILCGLVFCYFYFFLSNLVFFFLFRFMLLFCFGNVRDHNLTHEYWTRFDIGFGRCGYITQMPTHGYIINNKVISFDVCLLDDHNRHNIRFRVSNFFFFIILLFLSFFLQDKKYATSIEWRWTDVKSIKYVVTTSNCLCRGGSWTFKNAPELNKWK